MKYPCNISVVANAATVQSVFAIYIHRDIDNIVRFVGLCPLTDVFNYPDALTNSRWHDYFGRVDQILNIEIKMLSDNQMEAMREQHALIRLHSPECNLKGYYVPVNSKAVMCEQTGETFTSAAECAKAHGVSASQLYNHLNRKVGYKSVKNRTYLYVTERTIL